jgi:ribonuclease R
MAEQLHTRILSHLQSDRYRNRPQNPSGLADQLNLREEHEVHAFRDALRELMHANRVVLGAGGAILLPGQSTTRDEFVGTYRQNKRGFGFVIPTDPASHEDLFIPEGENINALTGDIVRARITNREQRDGKVMYRGRITEVIERSKNKFVGTLARHGNEWTVMPDGNSLIEPILTPDAASRHIRPGTKVVVELTQYPDRTGLRAQGVITEVIGKAGEKDVDLKSVIVQFNLPGPFPDEVKDQARHALDTFDPESERSRRLDFTDQLICTIDPDDAKDYDDAISLRKLGNGNWELGVHIADLSWFVPAGTPLDLEAAERGNSCYFPGHVIPMLPEILSNGVCSLQEGVPRLCKSVFITYDDDAKPVGTKFVNTVIKSAKRLRYREAQAIIDNAQEVPHPDGPRRVADYSPDVVELLQDMNALAKRLHKRRQVQGQIVLTLPEVELVLDEDGKVVDAVPEDQSFTHTLIEMFMVEANEAVARLLDSMKVPFLRRTHPEPETASSERLRQFVHVAGFKLPKVLDRPAIQALLASVKDRPEAFAINLAILRSLTRAEYSPQPIGHYALASEHYAHFTSPIRRYADLTVHRLLDAYFEAREVAGHAGGKKRRKVVMDLDKLPSFDELTELGRHISFTERRGDDAERDLRQTKLLELLSNHIGDEFLGVVTGVTNFGVFIQLSAYLIDGLIRYEDLMDDWWDVDERGGFARGQRTGTRIGIGDPVKAIVVKVDVARRELGLSISQLLGRRGVQPPADAPPGAPHKKSGKPKPGKPKGGKGRKPPVVEKHPGKRGKAPSRQGRGRRGR